jgi:hypothetical protein
MTDPLEDRLRSHFADRAGRVTADPDPSTLVERSAGRPRLGVPLVAGLVAAVAVLTGGSFLTGMSVASSSPAPAARGGGGAAVPGALESPASGVNLPSTAVVPALTSLFTRTTTSGVTIRAYTSGTTLGVGPGPLACPAGMMCAQPITTPLTPRDPSANGGTDSSGSSPSGATASSGMIGPDSTISTVGTVPSEPPRCQEVTLEMSTDRAVSSVAVAGPTGVAVGPNSVELLATGSFGEVEGGPVGWVAVAVGSNVPSVQLVSSTGTVIDATTPASGVVVLAAVGSTVLGDASVVGLSPAGATLATVPVDLGVTPAPGCSPVTPGPPVTPPTTVPTTTTGPGGSASTTTTGPTTSTVVPSTSTTSVGPTTNVP